MTAAEQADRGAVAWRAVVHAQQSAPLQHSDFYVLAAHLSDTLRSARSLAGVLSLQVGRYDVGRELYDDSDAIDPGDRLQLSLTELQDLATALDEAGRSADRFQAAIGHIGYREPER